MAGWKLERQTTNTHISDAMSLLVFIHVEVDLVYKSTPHFQGQKWNFSSFQGKQMIFTPI